MTKEMLTVNIYPKLMMIEMYINCIENNHGNFFKINENIRNLYFKVAAILNKVCKDLMLSYIFHKMELRILNIACPLIKISITDGRRLILRYNRHFVFFHGGHLETIQNGGWDPRYRVLTS